MIGDGEAETGPLAASWHSNKFLDPAGDGAVLPILHLNGYKIANPTVLARIGDDELDALLRGYGYAAAPTSTGDDPAVCTSCWPPRWTTRSTRSRRSSERTARDRGGRPRGRGPRWPMIVLRTPKGWTGPKEVDGLPVEGTWRAHQVPLAEAAHQRGAPGAAGGVDALLPARRSCSTPTGARAPSSSAWLPRGERRLGANPHANGGLLLRDLDLPDFRDYAVAGAASPARPSEPTRVLGGCCATSCRPNAAAPQLPARRAGRDRVQPARRGPSRSPARPGRPQIPADEHLDPDGRVMEILSEHTCQGWLEGYLLTGRHGLFSCYEAFIHIVDSMVNQHAKWLKVTAAAALAPARSRR